MARGRLQSWLRKLFGQRGEDVAARYLRRRGMRIIVRGFRTQRGEIDLIARDGDVLVFVEVKTRRQGSPAEAVNADKERRVVLAALEFQKKHGVSGAPARFDVVAVTWPDDRTAPKIEHIRAAFDAGPND